MIRAGLYDVLLIACICMYEMQATLDRRQDNMHHSHALFQRPLIIIYNFYLNACG